eukprot:TRINITY_DN13404_c0_g1_i1.p1 TRINITY_DN13404_c0_g1~~TRINITY_DN13404_c0_g1_i1.p1  ORF type:complete len:118 (-),score=17.18 TRINITY_DN13404_c0_g1_i1:10-363(-)
MQKLFPVDIQNCLDVAWMALTNKENLEKFVGNVKKRKPAKRISPEEKEDFVTKCLICNSKFDNTIPSLIPMLLRCGHSFCYICLSNKRNQKVGYFECYQCKKPTKMVFPDRPMKGLG